MLVQDYHICSEISELGLVFKGPESSPFLAPRGVWIVGDSLLVSDTGRNRVFVWKQLPKTEFQDPDFVLGQGEVDGTGRNQNDEVSASSLQYPSAIWSDGKRVMVADAWNHRVLIWHELKQAQGQSADVVLGQPSFTQNEPNVHGLASEPTAESLYWPYGLHSNGKELWIADTGNRRVLYYDQIPTQSSSPATGVMGKADFSSRDLEPNEPVWPYSVRVNEKGQLAITDTQFFRVLLWNDWKTALGSAQADVIIGQPNQEASGQNQFFPTPTDRTLNWCYDSFFYKEGLLVMDTANSRVKWHPEFPVSNNEAAKAVIGPADFITPSENIYNNQGTEPTLYWPFSICVHEQTLAIADTGNHRVILNNLKI